MNEFGVISHTFANMKFPSFPWLIDPFPNPSWLCQPIPDLFKSLKIELWFLIFQDFPYQWEPWVHFPEGAIYRIRIFKHVLINKLDCP